MAIVRTVRNGRGDLITIQSVQGINGLVYKVFRNGAYVTESGDYREAAEKVKELGGS